MGNYYSVQIDDALPDIQSEEAEIIESSFYDVQPNFDPNEIFHPSAFDSPKRITDKQYAKVIKYSKEHHYVRCNFCLYLTNFSVFTGSGRFTHPPRDTITIIKDEKTHDDIVCLDCKYCNNTIEVKI